MLSENAMHHRLLFIDGNRRSLRSPRAQSRQQQGSELALQTQATSKEGWEVPSTELAQIQDKSHL